MRYPEYIKQLGKNVAELRKAKGWSQQELALEADIERRVLQRIEYGEGGPTVETLMALCIALKADIKDFFKNIPLG